MNTTINIEEIMAEIRASARSHGAESVPDFDSIAKSVWDDDEFSKIRFNEALYDMNVYWNVLSERPIGTRGGLIGKIHLFIKHIARKLIRFYIVPIVDDQNRFNGQVVNIMNQLSQYLEEHTVDECTVEYSELKHHVNAVLTKKVAALELENDQLRQCLKNEQEELAELRAQVNALYAKVSN